MHLEGKRLIKAPLTKVWDALLDPQILAKVTPGVKSLEPSGPDKYDALFAVKMGPVNGAFEGTMEVKDKVKLESFRLSMKVNGKIGNVSAEGLLKLAAVDDSSTEVDFSGDAQLTGTLARTGQRVMDGVAAKMTEQFFGAVEAELAADSAPGSASPAVAGPGMVARFTSWLRRLFGKN